MQLYNKVSNHWLTIQNIIAVCRNIGVFHFRVKGVSLTDTNICSISLRTVRKLTRSSKYKTRRETHQQTGEEFSDHLLGEGVSCPVERGHP